VRRRASARGCGRSSSPGEKEHLGLGATEGDRAAEDARQLSVVLGAVVLEEDPLGRPACPGRLAAARHDPRQRRLVELWGRHGHAAAEPRAVQPPLGAIVDEPQVSRREGEAVTDGLGSGEEIVEQPEAAHGQALGHVGAERPVAGQAGGGLPEVAHAPVRQAPVVEGKVVAREPRFGERRVCFDAAPLELRDRGSRSQD
jgi:hypothetical protein